MGILSAIRAFRESRLERRQQNCNCMGNNNNQNCFQTQNSAYNSYMGNNCYNNDYWSQTGFTDDYYNDDYCFGDMSSNSNRRMMLALGLTAGIAGALGGGYGYGGYYGGYNDFGNYGHYGRHGYGDYGRHSNYGRSHGYGGNCNGWGNSLGYRADMWIPNMLWNSGTSWADYDSTAFDRNFPIGDPYLQQRLDEAERRYPVGKQGALPFFSPSYDFWS